MHEDSDLSSDYADYERQKDLEGGLHTGREDAHKSKFLWLLLFSIIGLMLAFYLVSQLVP
jgi:hypothetical protein